MEWVRTRAKSAYRGDDGRIWNQAVMKAVGKGPPPPTEVDEDGMSRHVTPQEAKEYARRATRHMRITSGYRTGYIAGRPQGEAPMLRAARKERSHAAMVIQGGCRGCHMRGEWPGKVESATYPLPTRCMTVEGQRYET